MCMYTSSRNGGGRPGVLGFAVWACVLLCLSGLGYVWHRNRNAQLSRELQKRVAYLETIRSQNQQLDRQLEELRSPRALQAAVQKWQLGLAPPELVLAVPDNGWRPEASRAAEGNVAAGLRGAVASRDAANGHDRREAW
ncbi:MAG: hypothetical protein N3G20_07395 [Verrucomicrobiae bacterium]|nr:hypothetical protein [Verrucomicrobiae bacterium]